MNAFYTRHDYHLSQPLVGQGSGFGPPEILKVTFLNPVNPWTTICVEVGVEVWLGL